MHMHVCLSMQSFIRGREQSSTRALLLVALVASSFYLLVVISNGLQPNSDGLQPSRTREAMLMESSHTFNGKKPALERISDHLH